MANRKAYGYYIRGKQIAIVEQDSILGSGQTLTPPALNDVGPDGDPLWKSPITSVTNALEIEYAYSPRYRHESHGLINSDYYQFAGWGSDGDQLDIFSVGTATTVNLSSAFSADDYIVIEGSSRWNGLHQVVSADSQGFVRLKTPFNLRPAYIPTTLTFATVADADDTINGHVAADDLEIEEWKNLVNLHEPGGKKHLFIRDTVSGSNDGLFEVTYSDTVGLINAVNRITISATGEYTSTTAVLSAESGDEVQIHNVHYDEFRVYKAVNILNDESDEIDLPEYLSKALVYYVKAKLAEDEQDANKKEFFMKEYYRIIENHENSKIWGARMISAGPNAIR